jgi:hypothetical protein
MGPRLALNNIATSQAAALNLDSSNLGVFDAPESAPRVLEHHASVYTGNALSESVEVPIHQMSCHNFSRLSYFGFCLSQ